MSGTCNKDEIINMTKLEELQDKLNSKIRERDQLIIKLDKLQKELMELAEQSYTLDNTKTKIKCVSCRGMGYIQTEDGKKQCQTCQGKRYNWAEKFIEDNE